MIYAFSQYVNNIHNDSVITSYQQCVRYHFAYTIWNLYTVFAAKYLLSVPFYTIRFNSIRNILPQFEVT